jgi:hypothetical protein
MRFFKLGLSVALLVAPSPTVGNAQSIQELYIEEFPMGSFKKPSSPGEQEEEFLKSHAKILTDNDSFLDFRRTRAADWKYRKGSVKNQATRSWPSGDRPSHRTEDFPQLMGESCNFQHGGSYEN